MSSVFTKAQWRIFLGCFIAYSSAYIARLNLAAALPDLIARMNLTEAQGGMLQTGFALTYAVGQLVNGSMVDRISARRHIMIGMLGSAAFNALMGTAQGHGVLLAFWCLNGAAQSMLWTPIVKIMATWYRGKARSRVSFGLSMSMIAGHLGAWAVSGYMATLFGWRLSFFIPAAVIGSAAVAARLLLRDRPASPEEAGMTALEGTEGDAPREEGAAATAMPIRRMLLSTGLIYVLFCCVANGFVRDGVMTWAPSIIGALGGAGDSVLLSLVIPLLNMIGILTARRIYARLGNNGRKCTMLLMAASSVLSILILAFSRSAAMGALLLGLTCASTYGINPMLTTLIPMEYDRAGRVGMVAGMVDCFIYLGSSLAGFATGLISDGMGWNAVFVTWCLLAALGAALAVLSLRDRRKLMDWGRER